MLESVEYLSRTMKQKETYVRLNKKIKNMKKYVKKIFYNENIKVYSSIIENEEKNSVVDVDANVMILDMLYKKPDKKTDVILNNLTDRSIVSVDVIDLSEDKLAEFVRVCKKLKRENLIKPELEKHNSSMSLLTKELM